MPPIRIVDEEGSVSPASDPRPARRCGSMKPLGAYAAAVILRLEQELPRIRVEKRIASPEELEGDPL